MQETYSLPIIILGYAWSPDAWPVLVFTAVVAAVLWWARPGARTTLRNTLYFLAFGVLVLVIAGIFHVGGYIQPASILKSTAVLLVGDEKILWFREFLI